MAEIAGQLGAGQPRRFQPYPEYRDSGVEWLGEIPTHWDMKRLKTLASVQLSNVDKKSTEGELPVELCNYVDVYYNDAITADLDFMKATATPEQLQRFQLRAGDVLITKDSESWNDIAVSTVVPEDLPEVLCGYHLAQIQPGPDLDGRFLARQFSAIGPRDQFHVAANGITRFGLGRATIRTGLFPVATMWEQQTIAAFLGRETAKIDALVAKKERLIELLQEKRTAFITGAVTRGLDPNVPMRDSGVEWLGEIPAHWEVVGSRVLFTHRKKSALPDDQQLTASQQYGVIPQRKFIETEGRSVVQVVTGADILKHVEPNDFVMSMRSFQGGLEHSNYRGRISSAYVIVRPSDRADSGYFSYALKSTTYIQALQSTSDLVRDGQALRFSNFVQVPLPLIPPQEQKAITSYLDEKVAQLDRLGDSMARAIRLLKEYRTALISAAVTGKIDVRKEAE